MTSRDWRADRGAVFDRDEHTCRNCGADGDATLRTYPVGDVPLEGDVHESALVTVCEPCFETLRDPAQLAPESVSSEALFELVRETTRLQGAAITDVASFASLATSLPAMLGSDAGTGTATDPDSDSISDDELPAEFTGTRRDVLLALEVVDARLERLAGVETEAFDADVRSALEEFSETATALQSTLRTVVSLGETVAAGIERCHGCFDQLDDGSGSCATCGLDSRETADWEDEGALEFERLFAAINDRLQGASTTTETLTDRTMVLAEALAS